MQMKTQLLTTVSLSLTLVSTAVLAQVKKPNILFIQCDQLNTKVLSCYGGPIHTPNIDNLAKNGVKFMQTICTTPSSSPSRGSMVTGLFPHQNGIVRNINYQTQEGIYEKDITTDKLLHQAGYNTHHYGKWHLENGKDRYMNLSYFPDPYTFERQYQDDLKEKYIEMMKKDNGDWMDFYGFVFPVELSPYMKKKQPELDRVWGHKEFSDFAKKIGRLRSDIGEWHDDICARKAVETIRKNQNSVKPFAVTCSFIWPHDPNFITDPYYSQFAPEDLQLPANGYLEDFFKKNWGHEMVQNLGPEGVKEFLRVYYGTVKYLDDKVGDMMKALAETGQLNNTLVIFTADHGDMIGRHSMIWKSTEAFYDEIVSVPLIISYPGKIKPRVSTAQVNGIDFMPTILQYAGLPIPEGISGKSLKPLLLGKENDVAFRKYNFSERVDGHMEGKREILPSTQGSFMVQDGKMKYAIYSNGLEYCYDMKKDPDEFKNVIKDPKYAEKVSVMKKAMKEWLKQTDWKGKDPFKK